MKSRILAYTSYFFVAQILLLVNSCGSPQANRMVGTAIGTVITGVITQSSDQKPTKAAVVDSPSASSSISNEAKTAEIKEFIKFVDDIEIQAFRNLNPNILSRAYTGQALQRLEHQINELREQNVYKASTLEGQQFHDIKISPDGTFAKAEITEKWSTEVFTTETNKLLGKYPPYDTTQIVYLEKSQNQWRVSSVEFQGESKAKFVRVDEVPQQANTEERTPIWR
jgi:hypothetical protein